MRKVSKVEQTIPEMREKKKVAAYARISMESERMNHSLSTQISYYSGLIQKNPDWEYAGVYSDDGISGTSTRKRDGFKQMVADAEAGKIDIILTKSIQRFARNTVDLLETVRHLKDIGVEVRFEKENINSMSGDGELMLTILASFAQEESRSISENVKWGVKKKFEQGIPNGKFRIFGYDWEDDHLVIVPEEAEIVRRIFQNFLDGKSRLETEREFAEEGITTRDGNRWVDSNIAHVLHNITYTGNLLLQKEYIEDPITKHRKRNRGELPKYYVENTHEPIIDKETFDYVQAEMARRKELGPFANKSLNITCFTSKLKCEKCGCSFVRNTRKNRAKVSDLGDEIVGWVCWRSKLKNGGCKANEIPERILRTECAAAMGMDEFDEDAFLERVDKITIPEQGTLHFYFTDGTETVRHWVSTAKKDYWTPERRAEVSKRRRQKASAKGASCFTSKLKCPTCGCNFRHQLSKSSEGKTAYWRCATPHKPCGTTGMREERLKTLTADVLGIPEFDDKVFLDQIDHIDVWPDSILDYHFKDGRTERRTIDNSRVGHKHTEEHKEHMRQIMKEKKGSPEARKHMSETMKRIRKERGDTWGKRSKRSLPQ